MNHITPIGTFSGTALTVAVNMGQADVIKTVVLAAIGAAVSFAVTVLLKWAYKAIIKRVSGK